MNQEDKLKQEAHDWKQKGYDQFVSRSDTVSNKPTDYIPAAQFEIQLDEMLFNRMIKLKDLRQVPQGNDPGKIYWDGENQKFKIWIGDGGWADVLYTSTSTSSTSTSSTSTSTT